MILSKLSLRDVLQATGIHKVLFSVGILVVICLVNVDDVQVIRRDFELGGLDG